MLKKRARSSNKPHGNIVFDGLTCCARYAVPPHALNYCGPQGKTDLETYALTRRHDRGLEEILEKFEALYPYLVLIAAENRIQDPFDIRVVEAYWMGNELLDRVSPRKFHQHLTEALGYQKRLDARSLSSLTGKLNHGAIPHHTYHVLNVFSSAGSMNGCIVDTAILETLENCRIGWGRVEEKTEGWLIVIHQSIEYQQGQLQLGKPITKKIDAALLPEAEIADWVSFHWSRACDILSSRQVKNLTHYTQMSLRLANTTL